MTGRHRTTGHRTTAAELAGDGARRNAELRGRIAEVIAAALLVVKGYRIIARRHRTRLGEIDLIAVRGRRLAFVEVKQRRTLEEARFAVSARQANRLADAVEQWLGRNPRYREHRIGLDTIVLGRALVPHHVEDALHAW